MRGVHFFSLFSLVALALGCNAITGVGDYVVEGEGDASKDGAKEGAVCPTSCLATAATCNKACTDTHATCTAGCSNPGCTMACDKDKTDCLAPCTAKCTSCGPCTASACEAAK